MTDIRGAIAGTQNSPFFLFPCNEQFFQVKKDRLCHIKDENGGI